MKTKELMLARSLGRAARSDYVNWAVARLADGMESSGLRILAGLHPEADRDEVEPYFLQSCAELGLTAPDAGGDPRQTAFLVRELYEGGDLGASECVDRMAELYRLSESADPLLGVWHDMEEELCLQGSGYEGVFYAPEALQSLDETVVREWELFAEGTSLDLPGGYERFVRCERCLHIAAPAHKPRGVWSALRAAIPWIQSPPALWQACASCGSFECRGMVDPDVREDYFARQRK